MSDMSRLYAALTAAHEAGDTEAAQMLADYIRTLDARRESAPAPEVTPPPPAKPKESGVVASLKRGAKELASSVQTGVEAAFGDANEAARKGLERARERDAQYEDQVGLDKLKQVYERDGVLSAAGEAVRQLPHAVAQNLPSMGASAAGALAGGMAFGPAGAVAGAFLPSFAQQGGSNVERQASEQAARGNAIDVDTGAAALAAVPQAALDAASNFFMLGKTATGALFGPKVAGAIAKGDRATAEALAKEGFLGTITKGAAKGVAFEAPTEVVQQILERAQAGLNLTDDDALAEYGEALYQSALVGGAIGPMGRAVDKSAARGRLQQEADALRQQDMPVADDIAQDAGAEPSGSEPVLRSTREGAQGQLFPPRETKPLRMEQIDALRGVLHERDQLQNALAQAQGQDADAITYRIAQIDEALSAPKAQELLAQIEAEVAPETRTPGTIPPGFVSAQPPAPVPTQMELDLAPAAPLTPTPAPEEVRQPKLRAKTPGAQGQLFTARDLKGLDTAPPAAEATPIVAPEEARAPQMAPAPAQMELDFTPAAGSDRVVTAELLAETKIPLKTTAKWFRENVIGKPLSEVQAMIQANPELLKGNGTRAQILQNLSVPDIPPYQEPARAVRQPNPSPASQQPVEAGGSQSSVGVPGAVTATRADGTGGAAAAAPEPVAPDQLRLVPPGAVARPIARGALPEPDTLTAVTSKWASMPRAEDLDLTDEQRATVQAAVPINAVEPPAVPAPTTIPAVAADRVERALARIDAAYDDGALDIEDVERLRAMATGNPLAAVREMNVIAAQNKGATARRYSLSGLEAVDLHDDAVSALEADDLPTALDNINTNTDSDLSAAIATTLRPLLQNTRVILDPNLVVASGPGKGKPALGAASADGLTIWLNPSQGMNEETVLHEAVHAATERVLQADPATLPKQSRVAVDELYRLWGAAKADKKVGLSEAASQNVSEFVAEAMSNRRLQIALEAKPWKLGDAWQWFKRTILNMIGVSQPSTMLRSTVAAVDTIFSRPEPIKSGAGVRNYQVAPAVQARIDAMQPPQQRGFLMMLRAALPRPGGWAANAAANVPDATTRLRTQVADRMATVEDRFSKVFNEGVRDSLGHVNPILQLRQAEDADKLMLDFFQTGGLKQDAHTGLWSVVKAPGVRPPSGVLDLVKAWGQRNGKTFDKAKHDAGRLLEAVRLRELRAENARGANFFLHMSDAEIDALYNEYTQHPELREMNRLMDESRRALVDHMRDAGRITNEMATEWKAVVGYVPFDRLEELGSVLKRRQKHTGRGLAQVGGLPELVGSARRPVKNVFDNYFNTMGWMVRTTMHNAATVRSLRALERMGQARYLGVSRMAVRNPDRTVHTWINGADAYFELPSPYDVMAFVDTNAPLPGFARLLGEFSHVLRTAVTAVPTFSVKQVAEDVQRAALHSGVKNVGAMTAKALAHFAQLSKAEIVGDRHPIAQQFGRIGLTGEFDWRSQNPAESLLKDMGLAERKVLGSSKFGAALHKLEGIARASDLAVRKAIYDQTLVETGDAVLAQTRAREIINFRRRGYGWGGGALNFIVQTVPFFNAYVQGMDVLYRSLSGKNAASGVDRARALKLFYTRAAFATAFATMYALAKDDDEEYRQTDLRERDSSWMLGGGWAIPVPTELGMLFKVIPERVAEYMRREGTPEEQTAQEAVKTWAKYAFDQVGGRMVPLPLALRPALEVITNHSFMTGREIEGTYQKQLDPSRRTSSMTSELAKSIAAFARDNVGVEVSPQSIDTFLNGYLGTTAAIVTASTDALLNPHRADRPLHKMVGLGAFTYDPVGTRDINEFYELREKVSSAQNTLNDLKLRDPEAAVRYAEEHQTQLAAAKLVNSALKQLQQTRQFKTFLETPAAAEKYSSEERMKMIQDVRKLEAQLVGWVQEAKHRLGL